MEEFISHWALARGGDRSQLCSETRHCFPGQSGVYVVPVKTGTADVHFGGSEFRIRRSTAWASPWLPCPLTLSRTPQWFEPQFPPLENVGDGSCLYSLTWGVLKKQQQKTNEIVDLQERDAVGGTLKI